jgi:integrase
VKVDQMEAKQRPERKAVKLLKTELDRLLKADTLKGVWVTVEGLRGAYLRASGGHVGAYVKYREGVGGRGARQVAHMVGRYPPLTPPELEKRLRKALGDVAKGLDPQAERNAERKVLTVSELLDLYLAEGVSAKKPRTVSQDRSKIEGYIRPALGRMKLTTVSRADVERMRDSITAGRLKAATPAGKPPAGKRCAPGARVKGGKLAAAKTVKLLRAIVNFAIRRKMCAENPARGVEVAHESWKQRFLSPAELARLGDVLKTCDADPAHVTIIRLLLLTGCRKNEIVQLKWREVKNGYLQLEDSKTGPREVTLSVSALEVLNKIARGASEYVFPNPRDPSRPLNNFDRGWQKIRKAAGLEDVRVHDLRHSHASIAIAGGATLILVAKLLGHRNVSMTQRYAHLADEAVRAAADNAAKAIDDAMKAKVA